MRPEQSVDGRGDGEEVVVGLLAFIRRAADTSIPEPRIESHTTMTSEMAPTVSEILTPGASILDVGCGQGPALEWFGSRGFKVHGITVNQGDADACLAAGFSSEICDQNELSRFSDGQFDCVWARHVLEHSIVPYWTLSEFHRILKPNGILYAEMPAPDTDARHEMNPNHYSVLGNRMWVSLIDRAGFNIVGAKEWRMVLAGFPPDANKDRYMCFICKKT
jgi:SAM-dependent methyltransferase